MRKMELTIIFALSALLAIPYSQAALRFSSERESDYTNFLLLK